MPRSIFPGPVDFHVLADIGGFGVGSELSWSVNVDVQWCLSRHFALSLGYTWLSIDYDIGSGDGRYVLDLDLRGPQLGLTYNF